MKINYKILNNIIFCVSIAVLSLLLVFPTNHEKQIKEKLAQTSSETVYISLYRYEYDSTQNTERIYKDTFDMVRVGEKYSNGGSSRVMLEKHSTIEQNTKYYFKFADNTIADVDESVYNVMNVNDKYTYPESIMLISLKFILFVFVGVSLAKQLIKEK